MVLVETFVVVDNSVGVGKLVGKLVGCGVVVLSVVDNFVGLVSLNFLRCRLSLLLSVAWKRGTWTRNSRIYKAA